MSVSVLSSPSQLTHSLLASFLGSSQLLDYIEESVPVAMQSFSLTLR